MVVGNANLYATGPILSRIEKGPQYMAASLVQLPNLEFPWYSAFICLTLLPIMCCLQVQLDLGNLFFHFLE